MNIEIDKEQFEWLCFHNDINTDEKAKELYQRIVINGMKQKLNTITIEHAFGN